MWFSGVLVAVTILLYCGVGMWLLPWSLGRLEIACRLVLRSRIFHFGQHQHHLTCASRTSLTLGTMGVGLALLKRGEEAKWSIGRCRPLSCLDGNENIAYFQTLIASLLSFTAYSPIPK